MTRARVALCLSGGGLTGAMYQIGALAALEDTVGGLDAAGFDVYVGTATGASVSAALAGGASAERLYRSFLDPADTYFPLERSHLLRFDLDEWRGTLGRAIGAVRRGASKLIARSPAPSPGDLWEQLDRVYDSLPAGLFTLDAYEQLLEDFFLRRGIPTSFRAMPRVLRIPAYDLDSGERVVFGAAGDGRHPCGPRLRGEHGAAALLLARAARLEALHRRERRRGRARRSGARRGGRHRHRHQPHGAAVDGGRRGSHRPRGAPEPAGQGDDVDLQPGAAHRLLVALRRAPGEPLPGGARPRTPARAPPRRHPALPRQRRQLRQPPHDA